MSRTLPKSESLHIGGPAGRLQAVLDLPENADTTRFGVLCHPHPQHGGALTNKVVHTLARTLNELRIPTLRFNFRGVGDSEGAYDRGEGETEDALAVVAYGRSRWPNAQLWLGGFSFGGVIAVRAAQTAAPSMLITVAPAVTRLDATSIVVPQCPWLIVQGGADDIVDPQAVRAWAAGLNPPPKVELLAGVGHFFHGRLDDLRNVVLSFVASAGGTPDGPADQGTAAE